MRSHEAKSGAGSDPHDHLFQHRGHRNADRGSTQRDNSLELGCDSLGKSRTWHVLVFARNRLVLAGRHVRHFHLAHGDRSGIFDGRGVLLDEVRHLQGRRKLEVL